jgi:outer membrane protein TolC
LETSLKQYEAAQKTIEGAQAGYEIAKKRYDVGSGTLLELQDAQLGLLQARLNVNQSVYTYMILKSSLDKILGVNQIKQ